MNRPSGGFQRAHGGKLLGAYKLIITQKFLSEINPEHQSERVNDLLVKNWVVNGKQF